MQDPAKLMSSEAVSAGQKAGTGGASHPNAPTQRVATILVVEDEILTRMATAAHLRDSGYRVLEAATAEEARKLLMADEPISVVFSDINMPGMNGLALATWIIREFPDVKVVLTSADNANAIPARLAALFLHKPYDFGTLTKLFGQLL